MKGRDNLEDLSTDGRVIFKRLIKKWDGREWTRFIWQRIKTILI
jgi:hypothetical protein